MKTLLMALTALVALPPAGAAVPEKPPSFETGKELLSFCDAKGYLSAQAICDFYIVGVLDGLTTAGQLYTEKPFICLPKTLTNGQLNAIGLKEVRNHPTFLARIVLAVAWKKAFPCPS